MSWDNYKPAAETEENPTWGDYGKSLAAGVADPIGSLAGFGQYASDTPEAKQFFGSLRAAAGKASDDLTDSMTPEGRDRLSATLTSDKFWEHPFSALALKGTRMTPTIAALTLPGGLIADAGMAVAASSAAGGAMTAGDVVNGVMDKTKSMSDDELKAASKMYAGYRELYDEKEARRQYDETLLEYKPALAFAIGAITNTFGPAATAIKGAKGAASHSVLPAVAEGVASEGIEEGSGNALTQSALMKGGLQKDFDTRALVDTALEGGVLGGLFSGAAHTATRGGRGKAKADEVRAARDSAPLTVTSEVNTDGVQAENGRTGVASPPVEAAPIGNQQNEPTRSETQYQKTKAVKGSKVKGAQEVEVTDGLTTAEGLALADRTEPPVPADQQVTAEVPAPAPQAPQPAPQPAPPAPVQQVAPQAPVQQVAPQPAPRPTPVQPVDNSDLHSHRPLLPSEGYPEFRDKGPPAPVQEPGATPVSAPVTPTKKTGRILPNISEEAEALRAKGNEQLQKNIEKADVEPKKEASGVRKRGKAEQAVIEERNAAAKQIFEKHAPEERPAVSPRTPADRAALADQIGAMIDDARKAGLGPREELPANLKTRAFAPKKKDGEPLVKNLQPLTPEEFRQAHMTTPEKVSKTDPHVMYLREAMAVEKLLRKKSALTKENRERVERFFIAEKDIRAGGNDILKAGRKEEGERASRKDQGDANVEAPAGKLAKAMEEMATPVDNISPEEKHIAKEDAAETYEKVAHDAEDISSTKDVKHIEVKPLEKIKATAAEKRARQKAAVAKVVKRPVTPEVTEEVATPKPPPPIKVETAKDVATAAERTNTEPSQAQMEAGNYAKGKISWNGMTIAIETPKGETRKAKDGSWEVPDYPGHYGYVLKSKGADGDQVDITMGPHPDAPNVYVIDQQNHKTGKFDEHKSFAGYNSQADAMQAYDASFSDGHGYERIQSIQEMTRAEFKAWAESDKPAKARAEATKNEDVYSASVADEAAAHPDSEGDIVLNNTHNKTGKPIRAIQHEKARDVLGSLDTSHLSGVPKALADLLINRLKAAVGDTDVYTLSPHDIDGLSEIPNAKGLHALYSDGTNKVYMRSDTLLDPAERTRVAIHELTHVLTVRGMIDDPRLHKIMKTLMLEANNALRARYAKMRPELANNVRTEMDYAFSNEREFVAEAFSKPNVMEILARIPISKELASEIKGLNGGRMTLWDAFVHVVRQAVEKATGKLPFQTSVIEGLIRMGHTFEKHENALNAKRALGQPIDIDTNNMAGYNRSAFSATTSASVSNLQSNIHGAFQSAINHAMGHGLQEQENGPRFARILTLDQLAQAAAKHFRGENNPVRKIADLVEQTRVKATALFRKLEPTLTKGYRLEQKYKGAQWDNFVGLLHDETMAGVYADRPLAANTHLGKDVLGQYWTKEMHRQLEKRWGEANFPEDLKAYRLEAMKMFRDQQNAQALGLIKNRVRELLGRPDDALAGRVYNGSASGADATALGGAHALELVKKAGELAKIDGPYYPLIREGTHVVRARHDVVTPKGNFTKVDDNTFDFHNRKDATAYETKLAQDGYAKPSVASRWVDKNTGLKNHPDGTKVHPADTDAVQRFRVRVNNEHVEFHDSAREAQKAAFEMAKDPTIHVKGVEERKFEYDSHKDMLPHHIVDLIEGFKKTARFKDMDPAARNAAVQELHQASIRWLGSTRAQSRRLPRRYVEGASKDFNKSALTYAKSSSGYLAKLEHQPDLDAAVKDMLGRVTDDSHKNNSLARSAIANEVQGRLASSQNFGKETAWDGVVKRVMTVSFLDKLMGPSHNIINSLQPAMVSFPVLASRYGVARAFAHLSRAYNDIGGAGLAKSGLKDTLAKIKDGEAVGSDLFKQMTKGLNPEERAMMNYLAERGSIDPDAGFEVEKMIRSPGKLDAAIGKFEGIARQMPSAIEMINRGATALSAYRLERGRGATHEAAMAKAQETVNNTQGLYSASNAAPIFNHPVAKLSLQFKKYGQLMYHLIGSNIGRALKNADPADRAEAIKTLVGLTATHVAMAGALGLPTEPFKYLLMGAQAAGLTTTGWGDVENKVREQATNWFGKLGGEVATKGLPRLLGVDLSSRVGLDSLLSFSEPKSRKESDVKSYLFDMIGGAPASLVGDWIKGANNLTDGNFVKGAEQLVPMKFASDIIKAYRLSTEGKKGSTGKETMAPYNVREALTRAAGFTPAREAETGAARSAFYSQSKGQTEERSGLVTSWVTAKPQDKVSAWKAVQSYNKGVPAEAQITMSDLQKASERRRKEGDATKTNKRTEYIQEKADRTYNP